MPTVVTIHFQTDSPLFFDESWPLEPRFLEILKRSDPNALDTARREDGFKPYTLSPIWRTGGHNSVVADPLAATAYRWRVCLLDDALAPSFLEGLEEADSLDLNGTQLGIDKVSSKEYTYHDMVRKAQARAEARPNKARYLGFEFLTPTVLYRSGLPMPLPDPALIFRYYLSLWDTFAPRELWHNFNLLDAIQFHVAPTEHHLETRRVRWNGKRTQIGLLGSVIYTAHKWQKLGTEFLGTLQALARFSVFCGTGEGTARGLGQTRCLKGRLK